MNKLELQKTANEIRKGIITAVYSAKAGHPGGSLSAAELFTYLYFEEMNIDPANPEMRTDWEMSPRTDPNARLLVSAFNLASMPGYLATIWPVPRSRLSGIQKPPTENSPYSCSAVAVTRSLDSAATICVTWPTRSCSESKMRNRFILKLFTCNRRHFSRRGISCLQIPGRGMARGTA